VPFEEIAFPAEILAVLPMACASHPDTPVADATQGVVATPASREPRYFEWSLTALRMRSSSDCGPLGAAAFAGAVGVSVDGFEVLVVVVGRARCLADGVAAGGADGAGAALEADGATPGARAWSARSVSSCDGRGDAGSGAGGGAGA
jgi:hypothetical protein